MAPRDEEFVEQSEGIDLLIGDETRRILTEWVGIDPTVTPEAQQAQIDREALRLQKLTEDAAQGFERATSAPAGTYWNLCRPKRRHGEQRGR